MRQTKSLAHFEILYVYSKVSFRTLSSLWTKSKSRIRAFFWLSVRRKLSLSFFEEKLSPGVSDLVNYFQINNFSFCLKRCSEALEQYFWDFLGSHREKISRWKNLFVFQRLMFFVPVSQLSTRDLFYFLENLKIRQDVLSWVSRFVRSFEQRALWFPYSRFLEQKMFKKILILECLGCFTKSIVVSILDFWHISFRKMFKLLTCKRNHNFWVLGVM